MSTSLRQRVKRSASGERQGTWLRARIWEGQAKKWKNDRARRRSAAKEGRGHAGQGLQRTGKGSLMDQSASFFLGTTSSTLRKLAEGARWQWARCW